MAEAQSAVSRFKKTAPAAAPVEDAPAPVEAPKRRGRPPKAVVEGAEPKKRGRKPQAEQGPLPETLADTDAALKAIEANIKELRKQLSDSVAELAREHARLSKHRSTLLFQA